MAEAMQRLTAGQAAAAVAGCCTLAAFRECIRSAKPALVSGVEAPPARQVRPLCGATEGLHCVTCPDIGARHLCVQHAASMFKPPGQAAVGSSLLSSSRLKRLCLLNSSKAAKTVPAQQQQAPAPSAAAGSKALSRSIAAGSSLLSSSKAPLRSTALLLAMPAMGSPCFAADCIQSGLTDLAPLAVQTSSLRPPSTAPLMPCCWSRTRTAAGPGRRAPT